MLSDTQAVFRRAIVTGDMACTAPLLAAGVEKRIEIHRRNYQSSLVNAILGKFPAVAWLVGAPYVAEAARCFVEEFPPQAPCIAEYGEAFPQFLARQPGSERTPYLQEFAELERTVGYVTIAADTQPVTLEALSWLDSDSLQKMRLRLQDGARYLRGTWPVDHLIKLYLTDAAPEHLVFEPSDVFLEIRGSRGEFSMTRLEEGAFRFRRSLAEGLPIGTAAEIAMDSDDGFDPGTDIVRIISEGLVTAAAFGEGDKS